MRAQEEGQEGLLGDQGNAEFEDSRAAYGSGQMQLNPGGIKATAPSAVVTWVPRVLYLTTAIVVARWCMVSLGGIHFFTAEMTKGGDRSTTKLFNSHPLLMVLAYVVCMSEAIMAYKAPPSTALVRSHRKLLHAAMHSLSAIFVSMGLYSAFQSHNLAVPPIPNMYSLHSYLGLFTAVTTLAQYAVSMAVFYYPGFPYRMRALILPIHKWLGLVVYVMGIATINVGIQEKSTFLQTLAKKPVYGSEIGTGVALGLMSVFTAMSVVFAVQPVSNN